MTLSISMLLVLAMATFAADYSMSGFETAYTDAVDGLAASVVCRDYLTNSTDIDVRRVAQDKWSDLDKTSVLTFCNEMVAKNPKSAAWAYLAGRVAETPLKQIEFGRLAIKLDKKWPYGYRLLCATYLGKVINGDPESSDFALLKPELLKDEWAFKQVAELAPDQDWAQSFYYDFLIYQNDYKTALKLLDTSKKAGLKFASNSRYALVNAGLGKFESSLGYISADVESEISSAISGGFLTSDQVATERNNWTMDMYGEVLSEAGQNAYLLKWLKNQPNAATDPSILFKIATTEAGLGNTDNSFESLGKAANAGFDQVGPLEKSEEFSTLRGDSRWNPVVDMVKANWALGAPKRKAEFIAKKFSKPAPDWTLQDPDGNPVQLSALKGQVVVLDFWATWCGPCRMSMPVIDKYVKESKPAGVRVFSVNTWDNNPVKAAAYMKENGYAMELIYGTNEVAKAYEITGIPYICVVDKEGIIRYEAKGYSDALQEELACWVEDLIERK